jgi:hypothetical protein
MVGVDARDGVQLQGDGGLEVFAIVGPVDPDRDLAGELGGASGPGAIAVLGEAGEESARPLAVRGQVAVDEAAIRPQSLGVDARQGVEGLGAQLTVAPEGELQLRLHDRSWSSPVGRTL